MEMEMEKVEMMRMMKKIVHLSEDYPLWSFAVSLE
jgi:hypothetical protein